MSPRLTDEVEVEEAATAKIGKEKYQMGGKGNGNIRPEQRLWLLLMVYAPKQAINQKSIDYMQNK